MSVVIVDAREWQNMLDLRTGKKIQVDSPAVTMTRGVLKRHPYPGDLDLQSNRWVTDTALDLIHTYTPRLVCLSYAQQYFSSRFKPLTEKELAQMINDVFEEAERFLNESGYTPVIVGTGDMTELAGEMELSKLDGLAFTSGWSARYAGLHQPSIRDLEHISGLPGFERLVSREEWINLFDAAPYDAEIIPDYLLVAREGWSFRAAGTPLRRAVRVPAACFSIPVATPLGEAQNITGIRALVEKNLENTKIALIVIEGVGLRHFPLPHAACSNSVDWYYYEPGEGQYLTLTTGIHQVFTYPSGYRYHQEDHEQKEYPLSGYFTKMTEHTLGEDFNGRSIAVGNRSMFTHMVYGADISVECFARNLYNQGCMAVIHRTK